MQEPPQVKLPAVKDVKEAVAENAYVAQLDGRSWFFQIAAPQLQDYFVIRTVVGVFQLVVLAMGWAWSVYVAQTTASVIMTQAMKAFVGQASGMVYIDNFLIFGADARTVTNAVATLESVGFVERVPRSEPLKCVLPAFAVEKGEQHSRAIVDGRPLNELMEPPPKFSLLRVDEVIAKMMSKSYAVVVDLKSYFFQFPVGRSTSAFFGLRTRKLDGGVALYRWRRLTMGWSFSPVIAQDSALVITEPAGDDKIVWYDDWALVEDCPDALRAVRDRVLRRARKVRMTVNDEKSVLEPSSKPVVLGVEFDLAAKTYRLKQEWARKAHLLFCSAESAQMTVRGIWKVVGTAIWAWTVWGTPLCRVSPVLAWMGTLAHQVLTGTLGGSRWFE
ncbi:hypothetical protein DIPPA_26328 [Diplonema papillatum]|nr:hypothetical protein DIPPA_26328 [Diplonema papillatum]